MKSKEQELMGAETIICEKVKSLKQEIKTIQKDFDKNLDEMRNNQWDRKEYYLQKDKNWTLGSLLSTKKRILKKYLKAAKDMGVKI